MASAPSPRVSGGRGRGRAKNLATMITKPGENNPPVQKYISLSPQALQNVVDFFKSFEKSLTLCLREPTQENLQTCLLKTEEYGTEYGTSDETIRKVVSSLFEKCLEEQSLAVNGGQVAAILISSEKIGEKFRNLFLKKVQETFKNRTEECKTAFQKYLCFSVLLCSIYRDVRVNGQVMKILTNPVYAFLVELLEHKSDEFSQRESGMDVFQRNLFMVGSLLQESDKAQMDELFKKVRGNIVKEKSPKISCILMETFECYLTCNWMAHDETKKFYNDLMKDVSGKS